MFVLNEQEGWFALEGIDMSGISAVGLMAGWQSPPKIGIDFEVRVGSPDGELIGTGSMKTPQTGQGTMVSVPIKTKTTGKKNLYLLYKKEATSDDAGIIALTNAMFN